jgi:hypothetical protein
MRICSLLIAVCLLSFAQYNCNNVDDEIKIEGCTGTSADLADDRYGEVVGDGQAIYVNMCSSGSSADGSIKHPFTSINDAISSASNGDSILVADGQYVESITVTKPVNIIGAGSDRTTIRSEQSKNRTLLLEKVTGVSLRGFSLRGTNGLGLKISESSEVEVTDVDASDFKRSEDLAGAGIYVSDSNGVSLREVTATGSDAFGIMAAGSTGRLESSRITGNGTNASSGGVALIEGSSFTIGKQSESVGPPETDEDAMTNGGCVISGNVGQGIYVGESVGIIIWSIVRGNEFGGITFVNSLPGNGGKVDDVGELSGVHDSLVDDNRVYGIAAFGGNAEITHSAVRNVRPSLQAEQESKEDDVNMAAHGIVATTGSSGNPLLTISDVEIEGCQGTGVLLDGTGLEGGGGNIDAVSIIIHVIVNDTKMGGIWIQKESLADVIDCQLTETGLAGIGFTSNSKGLIQGNKVVSATVGTKYEFEQHRSIDMGDGIFLSGLKTGSSVQVALNEVLSASRNGFLIDNSNLSAFMGTVPGESESVNFFAANSAADGIAGVKMEGDSFAIQSNCSGFDEDGKSEFTTGGTYYDAEAESFVVGVEAMSTGSFQWGTSYETVSNFSLNF